MDMKKADRQAEQWHRWLIVQRYFRGWHTYVRQQEIKLWEKERRAKVHYQWSVFMFSQGTGIFTKISCWLKYNLKY